MLIAIDGTGPELFSRNAKNERKYDEANMDSFCKRVYLRSRERNKRYFRGPTTFGGESSAIADQVVSVARSWYEAGDQQICLAGHSRGGHIAIVAAERLRQLANCTPKLLGLRIDFLGLFDAVDRDAKTGSSFVSGNVDFVYHARRSRAVGSRSVIIDFGQTGTNISSARTKYEERFFACTHAGIGGTPWTGDHPGGPRSSGRLPDDLDELMSRHPERPGNTIEKAERKRNPSGVGLRMQLTEHQDKENSRQVWFWMESKLRLHKFI